MSNWILDFYKQKFNEGANQGRELKQTHKKKIKGLFRRNKNE